MGVREPRSVFDMRDINQEVCDYPCIGVVKPSLQHVHHEQFMGGGENLEACG
jgi:hypothetical protein